MEKEIEIIRYLLDEIEQRNKEIKEFQAIPRERGGWEMQPQKQLIIDNAKKIRALALKIGKQV